MYCHTQLPVIPLPFETGSDVAQSYPQTSYVAEDNFKLPILLPPQPEYWN